jgi:hypothetical protein
MPMERINILDYRGLGQKVIQWAQDQTSRPKDLAEFERQLAGIIEFPLPSYIKSLLLVQNTKDLLLIRLPPADLVEDTLTTISQGGNYRLPGFYEDRLVAGTQETSDNRKFFDFRVGDYSLAHCA